MRNVRLGLAARTNILSSLEVGCSTVNDISEHTGMSHRSTLHHLHLLEERKIVKQKTLKPPYEWELTGLGYGKIDEY